MPVVEVCMRARLREGIAGQAGPAALHLSARENLTQGTDLAFPSVMSRPIVILPARQGGRSGAKDAESDRHDQGGLSSLEHCLYLQSCCCILRDKSRRASIYSKTSFQIFAVDCRAPAAPLESDHATHPSAPFGPLAPPPAVVGSPSHHRPCWQAAEYHQLGTVMCIRAKIGGGRQLGVMPLALGRSGQPVCLRKLPFLRPDDEGENGPLPDHCAATNGLAVLIK
jgi:hypothetical protein